MGDNPKDTAIYQTEEDYNLSPEQAHLRVRALDYIDRLVNDSRFVDLLSAEDIFIIYKEVTLYCANFFNEEFWTIRYRNPDIIVGETNTNDKKDPLSGTVMSQQKFIYKKSHLPANPQIRDYFYDIYSVILNLERQLLTRKGIPNLEIPTSVSTVVPSGASLPGNESQEVSKTRTQNQVLAKALDSKYRRIGYNFRKFRKESKKQSKTSSKNKKKTKRKT